MRHTIHCVSFFLVVGMSALVGCADDAIVFDYPLDDVLRLDSVQASATHNSYHIAPDPMTFPRWNYTHPPLRDQVEAGVRQLELDVNMDFVDDTFWVYHIFRVDAGTQCQRFVDCLRELKDWSDDHPAHHPLFIQVDIRDPYDASYEERLFDALEAELLSVWPKRRIITPDEVRGDHATLRDALATDGWPTLGESRGRVLFFLFTEDEAHRQFYASFHGTGTPALAGRPFFVIGSNLQESYTALINLSDPIATAEAMAEALAANVLVRTHVEVLDDKGVSSDPARLEAAMVQGAHFLNTDTLDLSFADGAPSRCNPVRASAECTATALEDPAFMH